MKPIPELTPLLKQLAADIRERMQSDGLVYDLIGIQSGGVWLARHLAELLEHPAPVGELDISFYRDDFTRRGLHPVVRPSRLPFTTDERNLLLIDDVIMSGRTIRAAMNELFDYGRPRSIRLAVVADAGGRELPLQPDFCATRLILQPGQYLQVHGPDHPRLEIVEVDS